MRPENLRAKQQRAAALLPVGRQRGEMQQHQSTGGLAVGCCAAEGALEEVGELRERDGGVSLGGLERKCKRENKDQEGGKEGNSLCYSDKAHAPRLCPKPMRQ